MSNLGVPAENATNACHHKRMIKRNNDGQKSLRKKITPIIFLPLSFHGISHSATSLPFLPTLRHCYPVGCSYTMPNGRPGTLIEISFLIEGTYLVVKSWKGREELRERGGTQDDANEHFDFSPPVIFLQSAFYLNCRLLFTSGIS